MFQDRLSSFYWDIYIYITKNKGKLKNSTRDVNTPRVDKAIVIKNGIKVYPGKLYGFCKGKGQLTTISAMTRGCLNGRRRNASSRVKAKTMHICKIRRGSAKWRGSSPWKTPFEVAFIGGGHLTVALEAISQQRKDQTLISKH